MKRIITIFSICVSAVNLLTAQTSGGPDAYGYTWRNNNDTVSPPVYSWIDITGFSGAQNVRFLTDDNTVGPFSIGFPFHYYWYDVSQFWVGSNGYISFQNGQISSPFPSIPSSLAPQNVIAPFASDLIFGSAGDTAQCWHWTNAALDTMIVSYINVPFYQTAAPGFTGSNSFQIILSMVDSSITFQYREQQGLTITTTNYISIGIENNSGIIGLQPIINNYPPPNSAIKFYYPRNYSYSVSDASTTYNNNPETGGLFLSNLGRPFTMNTNIKNTGNQTLPAFNVFSRVLNSSSAIQAQNTVMSNALAPGQSQSITMPNPFNPAVAGTYTFVTNTQLSTDNTPSNDQKVQELQVVDTTAANIRLSYDSGVDAGLGGLNWTGGEGGGGVYFVPPFYPARITQLHSYIVNDPNSVGFSMEVFADNGIAGSPGSMLDSETVTSATEILNGWNTINLATPLVVTSGGVYVSWSMNGLAVSLGQDNNAPFSNRTFEVVGNTWAIYRMRETMDLMINITIQKVINAGVDELSADSHFGEFYPNPSSSATMLNYDLPVVARNLSYEILDMQGKLIEHKMISQQVTSGKLSVNTAALSAGIYTCKINVDGENVIRKLVVTK